MRTMICAAALVFIQSGGQSFAGIWTAELAGQQYARLQLTVVGTNITGNITLGGVHLGRDGSVDQVTKVTQDATVTPIFDVVLSDGVLSFARQDKVETDRFEMRVVNGDAQLTVLLRPDDRAELTSLGIAGMQPIPLKRTPR